MKRQHADRYQIPHRVWSNLELPVCPQAEADEFLWRIGPLNCYNPMKPDRFYDLDLAHRDDREVCKVTQGAVPLGTRLGVVKRIMMRLAYALNGLDRSNVTPAGLRLATLNRP